MVKVENGLKGVWFSFGLLFFSSLQSVCSLMLHFYACVASRDEYGGTQLDF